MKKIFFAIIICSAALAISSNAGAQNNAKSNDPAVDTKAAEALKKQATDKTNIPDSEQRPVAGKQQQDAVGDQKKATAIKEEEQLKGKAIAVSASVPPVAQDKPRGSTIDESKQPPARTPAQPMVPKEAQKVDN